MCYSDPRNADTLSQKATRTILEKSNIVYNAGVGEVDLWLLKRGMRGMFYRGINATNANGLGEGQAQKELHVKTENVQEDTPI